jgi:hypothetical protein
MARRVEFGSSICFDCQLCLHLESFETVIGDWANAGDTLKLALVPPTWHWLLMVDRSGYFAIANSDYTSVFLPFPRKYLFNSNINFWDSVLSILLITRFQNRLYSQWFQIFFMYGEISYTFMFQCCDVAVGKFGYDSLLICSPKSNYQVRKVAVDPLAIPRLKRLPVLYETNTFDLPFQNSH